MHHAQQSSKNLHPTSNMGSTAYLQAPTLLLAPVMKQGGCGKDPLLHASLAASHRSRRRPWLRKKGGKTKRNLCATGSGAFGLDAQSRGATRVRKEGWVTRVTFYLSLVRNEGPRTINGGTRGVLRKRGGERASSTGPPQVERWPRFLTCRLRRLPSIRRP